MPAILLQIVIAPAIAAILIFVVNLGFAAREIARLAVVGRNEPVTVYEPMPKEIFESRKDILNEFSSGLDSFYKGKMVRGLEIFKKIK